MNIKKKMKFYETLVLFTVMALISFFPIVGHADFTSDNKLLEYLAQAYYYYEIPSEFYEITNPADKINSLHDPYSRYFTAEEYAAFIEGIDQTFVGIGVYIEQVDEGILVTSVLEGSGAYEAGLQEEDIIISVDGKSLKGLSQEAATRLIKGKEGTSAELCINRDSTCFTVSVKRGTVHMPTVRGALINNNVGYIMILSFGQETNDEFCRTLCELEKQNPAGYILDLEANPGGYLQSAIDIIGYFAGGRTAVATRDKSGEATIYKAAEHNLHVNKPVILLTNRYSASASEIVAAAFKDYKAGIIIGERTFGKGTVQNMFPLPSGAVLKLTVEQFFSPLGKAINKVGISPDLTSLDVDPARLAALLFGQINGSNQGYMQFSFNGIAYNIDLSEASKPENWQIYRQIINLYLNGQADLKKGSFFWWHIIKQEDRSKLWKFYYPEYKELPALYGVPQDKQFTVTFRGTMNDVFLENNPIELIQSKTGKRVAIALQEDEVNKYKVVPQELLEKGETYYLVIHTGLASGSRHYGSLVEITVME